MTMNPLLPALTDSPFSFNTSASTPANGRVADPAFNGVGAMPGWGLIRIPPVSVCHHVSTIWHSPRPMCLKYHLHASGFMGSPTVPSNRRLESLCFCAHCFSKFHVHADCGGACVDHGYSIFFDYVPPSIWLRIIGGAFIHDGGCACKEWAVDYVRVSSDPANVSGAPVDIILFQVEDRFLCVVGVGHVASGTVSGSFGFSSGS